VRILSKRTLAEGVLLTFEQLVLAGDEGETVRDVIRHPGGVGVLPVEGEDVYLVVQHRAALGADVAEIPAGRLEPGENADPESAARRELEEEIGARAGRMIHLATSHPSPGYTDEVLELYAALELTWVGRRPEGWEERHLQVERMPFEEAVRRIGDGRISDAKTQVALLAWKELLRTGLVLEHGKEGTK